jgi:hypothetical protein
MSSHRSRITVTGRVERKVSTHGYRVWDNSYSANPARYTVFSLEPLTPNTTVTIEGRPGARIETVAGELKAMITIHAAHLLEVLSAGPTAHLSTEATPNPEENTHE